MRTWRNRMEFIWEHQIPQKILVSSSVIYLFIYFHPSVLQSQRFGKFSQKKKIILCRIFIFKNQNFQNF
jgi:hypothetical protein